MHSSTAGQGRFTTFDEARRTALDTLVSCLPEECSVLLAQIDQRVDVSRILDVRGPVDHEFSSGWELPVGECLAARAALGCLTRASPDARVSLRRRMAVHSYAAGPLVWTDGSVVGSLFAFSSRPAQFGPAEQQLVSTFARMLSTVLEATCLGSGLRGVSEAMWPESALPRELSLAS